MDHLFPAGDSRNKPKTKKPARWKGATTTCHLCIRDLMAGTMVRSRELASWTHWHDDHQFFACHGHHQEIEAGTYLLPDTKRKDPS